MCFGGDIRARKLERSIGGLQSQGYCVERLSLLKRRGGRDFFMLMRDKFLKEASSKDYVCLCSVDLACVSNSQSSCLVVEKWLQCVVLLHE